MNITGAIFDFDGTLFDSMPIWKGLKFKFFEKLKINLTQEDKKVFSGLYLMEALPLAKQRFYLNQSVDELYTIFWELLKNEYLEKALPKNDILTFIEKLSNKGVKMGIATATGEEALIPLLEKFNIKKYFSAIYSTYTVGVDKNSPKVFDTVLKNLGTNKETTWVFEDALYAAKTCKNNGYNVVGIYDSSETQADQLIKTVDIYIHNYSELNI